jgi:uncharacterized delta-60 repeat protein
MRILIISILIKTIVITLSIGAITAVAQPGTLDTSFASQGLARASTNGSAHSYQAAARQSDGSVVFVGSCTATTGLPSMCIARMNADGSFVESGSALGSRTWHHNNTSGNAGATAVAIDAEDRIVVAGYCSSVATRNDFCVVRFLPNGTLDQSFGNGGAAIIALSPGAYDEYATSLVIDEIGNHYVGGQCYLPAGGISMCVAALDGNGAPLMRFGTNGIGHFQFTLNLTVRNDFLNAIALKPNGGLILGGSCPFPADQPPQFCTIDVSASGARLTSSIMQASLTAAVSSSIRAMAWTYDRSLMLSGECYGGTGTGRDFCLARYDPNAAVSERYQPLDLSGTGVKRHSLGYQAGVDSPQAMLIQSDGRILSVGTCALNPATQRDAFCFQRYLPTGEEDRTIAANFDGVGSVVTEFVANSLLNDRALAVFLNHDGSMLVAGTCQGVGGVNYDICIAKYRGGPQPGTSCSLDIDGDGRFNPLVDGLIITRIALGLTTNAVTQGIQFPAHAVRRGWDVIASYLTTQCGVRGLNYTVLALH